MESFLGYLNYLRIIPFALEPKMFVDASTNAKLQNLKRNPSHVNVKLQT